MTFVRYEKDRILAELADRLKEAVYTPLADLSVTAWVTREPVLFEKRQSGLKLELRPGDKWGDLFDCAWFRFQGEIPASAAGQNVVGLIDLNGEAVVVDEKGEPLLGLTTVNSDYESGTGKPGKRVVPLGPEGKAGSPIEFWAEAGCNDLLGLLPENGTLKEARLAILHPEVRALAYDWEVLHELMTALPATSARRHEIRRALAEASILLNEINDQEVRAAREILAPELAKKGGDTSLTISAVGHAHLDLAWLWPIRETIRKGVRTFATALHLMDRYPDYVFGASQPQLYQWVKDRYPSLFARVKARVAEGRWEPQGAMWVEADTNIPGGESLVRQILFGKRFFREEFGKDIRHLWLPDVFGYSGALPQLLRQSGVDYFLTTKLAWNMVNRFPLHTFLWKGIDGSEVLAHLPPESTYNSAASPRSILKAEAEFMEKGVSDRCLLVFGVGDGGGGPGEEHLERLARERDLDGLCPVVQEPAAGFFDRVEAHRTRLETWQGELYLECHQGTYTSQARNKMANRRMEVALREAEWQAARALWSAGASYPAAQFEEIWKEVLLYQFHDILPGSSIARVYEESRDRYRLLEAAAGRLSQAGLAAFFRGADSRGLSRPMGLSNSLSWERNEFFRAEGRWIRVAVPAMGYAVIDLESATEDYSRPIAAAALLENELLRVRFHPDGSLASVWDKEIGREVLALPAAGNRLAVYRDPGHAWDFPMDYDLKPPGYFELKSAEASADGPRACIKQEYAYGASRLSQDVVLMAGSRRLDFVTRVDWRESGRMLRASFPVDVESDEAACEIQFGNIKRPTRRNTSWDKAKFEVCCHKWMDISDGGYGVAVLNNGKYGHKALRNVLDINLLRSPSYPDATADRDRHEFAYSLYPHPGGYAEGRVVQAAYELNVPLQSIILRPRPGNLSAAGSWLTIDAPNIIVESVKKAERGEALVVRLYEAWGRQTTARLQWDSAVGRVEGVNLLEEHPQPLTLSQTAMALPFHPFEIHTLRVEGHRRSGDKEKP